METSRGNVGVRKCPKCGSVWYTALPKCAFCGVEGDEIKGPIPPSKLNMGKGGVATLASPKDPAPPPAAPQEAASPAPAAASPDPAPVAEKTEPAAPEPKASSTPPAAPPPAPVDPVPPVSVEPSLPPVPPASPRKPERVLSLTGSAKAKPELRGEARQEERNGLGPPAPKIPSAMVPLVFGVLGVLACVGLPSLIPLRHDRVLGVLALLGWAVTAPFGPFAWFTGQRYLDRCLALGYRPAPLAATGKFLGMVTSFLLTLEFSTLSIFIAIQILSGRGADQLWK